MKTLKSVSFAVLCLAFITAFAFRHVNKSTKKLTQTWFAFNGTGSETNPADYNAYTGSVLPSDADCPGTSVSVVCAILTDDIYTTGPNTGLPKVDVSSSGVIGARIADVKADHDQLGTDDNGDAVFLREP